MSNKLKLALSAIVALVLVLGFSFFHRSQNLAGTVSNGADGGTTNFTSVAVTNGIGNGGIFDTVSQRTVLTKATTTPCAILSPNATSTLAYAQLQITTASSTATTWTLAKDTTPYATTTKLSSYSLGSGAQGTMVSTTTDSIGVDSLSVFAPSTYLVWGVQGIGSLTSDKLLGTCVAAFKIAQ